MEKPRWRDIWLPVLLAGVLIALDLAADRLPGTRHALDLSHVMLGAVVVVSSFALMRWAVRKQKGVEAVLRRARDELESRVVERTADLEAANEALQAEIAERRRVERELRTSEETARAMMNASSETALLLDLQGGVLASNAVAAARLNTTVDRLVGANLFDFFPPEVAERRRKHLDQILQTGQPVFFSDERAGRTYDSSVHPVLDAEGAIIRLAAFGRDITDHVRMNEELRASEAKYRLLFHNMAEGFALYELLYDAEGQPVDWRILEVNDAYTRHTGVTREHVVGRRSSEIYPASIAEYLPRFADVVASQAPVRFETYAKAVQRHLRVITFPAGGRRFASTILDISDRKHTQAELQRQAAILAQLNDAVIVLDADRRVTYWSPGAERMYGHDAAEVVGRTADDFPVPTYIGITRDEFLRRVAQDGKATVESIRLTRDGRQLWVETRAHMLHDDSGESDGLIVVDRDITARKQAEEALRRAAAELSASAQERAAMEERQRLARELHDSVSQVFYGISLGVHTALAMLDTDQDQARDALDFTLAQVGAGLSEMRALIFELRPELLEQEGLAVALKAHARSVSSRHGIRVELSLCDEPELSPDGKEALFRIAQEALQNAVRHARASQLDVRLTSQPDGYSLEVRDNGLGFDTAAAFPGHLGLHSMYERAALVGGSLIINSTPDCGTEIHAYVPRSSAADSTQQASPNTHPGMAH